MPAIESCEPRGSGAIREELNMITKEQSLQELARTGLGELTKRWWTLALRGAAAIIFGIICFAMPGIGFIALVALFGAYALVDGVLNLLFGIRSGRAGGRWGWLVFEGIIS